MRNLKTNHVRPGSWTLQTCNHRNTSEILRIMNPTRYMIFLLLAVSLVFWTQDLISEPLEDKPVAYLDESLDDGDFDEVFPGPEDSVVVDHAPELVEAPAPGYPLDALKACKSGTVRVKALVDTQGRVRKAIIEKPSGEEIGFEKSALEAAFKRVYRPAEFQNKPVAVWVSYEVKFDLDEE